MIERIYLDCETIPSGDKINPATLKPPATMSKPETIAKWYAEQAPAVAEEMYRKRALDSMQGEILCIGYAIDDEEPAILMCSGEEALFTMFGRAMSAAIGQYNSPIQFVGWNIRTFDIIWLWRKAIKYNLPALKKIFNRDRYRGNIIDLMEVWSADNRDYRKMDDVAKFLGLPGKSEGMDGSKVYDLYIENKLNEIMDYCLNDVETARDIYRRIFN